MNGKSIAEVLEAHERKLAQGNWIPANGGSEVPFTTRTGHKVLYCWQPTTGNHAYFDCGSDMQIPDQDLHLYGLG